MYFNHASIGAIAVKPIIDKYQKDFTEKEINLLWFIGITSSVLPDFDFLYFIILGYGDHRSFFTHGISLYILAFVLIWILSYLQKKEVFGRKFFKAASVIFLTGIATHFFVDLLMGGLALLSPFSSKIFGLEMGKNWGEDRLYAYLISFYMIIEVSLTSIFLLIFKGKKYIVPKSITIFYLLIAVFSFILVSSPLF